MATDQKARGSNPLWYTKKTHEIVSLFNLHKGFCVLSHALPCNRTPAGWRSAFASKLARFAITPVGYESLMVHQKDSRNRESFYLHKGFCVLSHALPCNRTSAGWHCIKKGIKKTRYCESFLCFRKFISCKRQSTRQSLSTFQVRES